MGLTEEEKLEWQIVQSAADNAADMLELRMTFLNGESASGIIESRKNKITAKVSGIIEGLRSIRDIAGDT